MRNPYAAEVYNGPWSDSDPQWTTSLLEQVGHTIGDGGNGIFFIPIENFREAFEVFTLCMYGKEELFADKEIIKITWAIKQTRYFTQKVDQTIFITFEADTGKMNAPTCIIPNYEIEITIVDNATNKWIKKQTIFTDPKLGYYPLYPLSTQEVKVGKTYRIEMQSARAPLDDRVYTVTLYTEKEKVTIDNQNPNFRVIN